MVEVVGVGGMVSKQLVWLAAMALLAGCDRPPGEANAAPAATAAKTPAAPARVEPSDEVIASGPVTVENQVEMIAEREGTIAQVEADLGTEVRAGQSLARLDDRQLAAQREALEAKMRSITADVKNWEALREVAESERQRADAMWKAQLITQQERERAGYKAEAAKFEADRERENLNQAQADLRALEIELAKMRVKAPFAGVVARRYVTTGQRVSKGEKLFWISATAPMRVRFMLPERYLGKVRSGTELVLSRGGEGVGTDARQGAKVVRISPVVDPASGTIEAIAELTGSGEFRPGMTADIRLKK